MLRSAQHDAIVVDGLPANGEKCSLAGCLVPGSWPGASCRNGFSGVLPCLLLPSQTPARFGKSVLAVARDLSPVSHQTFLLRLQVEPGISADLPYVGRANVHRFSADPAGMRAGSLILSVSDYCCGGNDQQSGQKWIRHFHRTHPHFGKLG